ncbi:MAG: type I pullulanase [Verrucomicrobiales bacterium]
MSTLPAPGSFGAELTASSVGFRVFAPSAISVWVVIYDNPTGPAGRREFSLLHHSPGLWETVLFGDWEAKFYLFRFAGPGHDDTAEVIDPWAVNTVDSSRRARLTDLRQTDPRSWAHGKAGPVLASPTDAVIYELHVRDFTISPTSGVSRRGGYLGWCEERTTLPGRPDIRTALDHLSELGVTHVQLMPIQDFDGDEQTPSYFWGYMTAAPFSPEGVFATDPMSDARCRELKQLIQALHLRGIGVILDVVLNHAGLGAPFDAHAPGYYFRHWPDGSLSNGSGCGNDFRTESEQGRRYITENLKFWVREYGVDGFRFDLMALFDRETLLAAERELRALNPHLLLYGEPWAAGPSPMDGVPMNKLALAGTSFGAFNDDFRHALKGPLDGTEPGFIQRGWNRDAVRDGLLGQPSWAPEPSQAIQYLTCHDNLCLYDRLALSFPATDDVSRRRAAALGYFLILLSQGVSFLHGGDEFFRTKNGDQNSYQSSDPINNIDWSRKATHFELSDHVRQLIALRRSHPLFRLRSREEVRARCRFHDHPWWDVIALEIDGTGLAGESWRRALVLVNGSPDQNCLFTIPPGNWTLAFGSADLTASTCTVAFQSGVVLAETAQKAP